MVLAALFVYACLFWAVTWVYPAVALVLIFAAAPFQNDISGGGGVKFSFAEIHLMLAIPIFCATILTRRRILSLGPMQGPIICYFAVCILSSIGTWRGNTAAVSLIQMFLFMVLAVLLFSSLLKRPEQLILSFQGLIAVGIFLSIVLFALRTNYVLGIHKNGIGGSLSCALLVCLELWLAANQNSSQRSRIVKICYSLALLFITAGLIFTLSRGAWLGACCGVIFIFALRRQFQILFRSSIILVPIIAVCWHILPKESKDYASDFRSKRGNIAARFESVDYARSHFEENPLYGVGVGLRKEYDATNLAWLTLAETGVLGLLAFLLIHYALLRMIWVSHRRFEKTDPLYSVLAIGGALIIARFAHGMVDHYWARGPTFMAWAAAGMATAAAYSTPRTPLTHSIRRQVIITACAIHSVRMAKAKKAL